MLNREIEGPRADASDQTSAAREQRTTAKKRRKSSVPLTPDTAAYHACKLFEDNPEACDLIAKQAIKMRKRGQRVSISALLEWARIEHFNLTSNCSPFRISNTIKAALSREFMRRYTELDGAFETRKAACDNYEGESVTPH